ncbi:DUF1365 domain-containing protein [Dongia sp.]|uniref:DUF1365 domain-containing protein n=1 Tax=Dongia sp. TaxID=1977262 RepID=UPI0035B48072
MKTALTSAIYRGSVMHRRLRPKAHYLRYSIFYLLLDLDELPLIAKRSRLLGIEKAAPLSFRAKDHGDGSGDLKHWVGRQLEVAGLRFEPGPIRLLTLPRLFGYAFNPISIYYCHDREQVLRATIYQVSNTFGGRHSYVLPVTSDGTIRQSCKKALYVSPFNDVSGFYRFSVVPPGDKVALAIDQHDDRGRLLQAAFVGRRSELTDGILLRLLILYPFMTLKVVAGIHWEALKLWLKGVPLHKRPASTDNPPRGETPPGSPAQVVWGRRDAELEAGAGFRSNAAE